jgi:hypothetical protein
MKTTTLVLAVGLAVALATPAGADGNSVDDDLAVVKNATASSGNASPATPEAAPRRSDDEPKWFRVRIVEKGQKKATVKINLPLFLVHAVGDDVPIPGCEGKKKLTLGEVLRALDSGENLVEIDDEDATVRVWVE